MTDGLQTSAMLPGLHRVRGRLAGGRVSEYWYAWRGGPRILKAVAGGDAALAQEVARLAPAAMEAWRNETSPVADRRFLAGLITTYLATVEANAKLAPRTKADIRGALDVARADLGTLEVKALESRRARSLLIDWRDRFAATPRTADARLGALAQALQWAADRGDLAANPLKDWPRIYSANRADQIWTNADLALLLPHCSDDFARAVMFAAHTGLRLGDLTKITRAAIGEHALVWATNKSRGRRSVVIPITGALRWILAAMPSAGNDVGPILTSSLGKPWSPWGLQTAMQRAKTAAREQSAKGKPAGAPPALAGLRFHDLRGTAATNFIRAGLTLDDTALIMGWERTRVEAIATRYVTSETIALAIVERMKRNKAGV